MEPHFDGHSILQAKIRSHVALASIIFSMPLDGHLPVTATLLIALHVYLSQLHTPFYRPQTKFAKVMFLHLSVSHSVDRGGVCMARGVCVCKGGHALQGGHVWAGGACMVVGVRGRGVCVVGGMHGRFVFMAWWGACMVGGMHGRGHACHTHPPRHYEIRSVNARAVRILLECILFNV